ncbi:MAG: alpha/beta hydrolase [Luteolibacter sp.]
MKLKTLTLIASLLFAGSLALPAQHVLSDAPGKSYVYKHSGGKPREMEIYFPPGHDPAKDKVPGVILFHGGGWTSGSLSVFRKDCQYLASRGVVAATAGYRMLTKEERAKLPKGESNKSVCVIDGKSAIRWFKQHADELGIDPSRIVTGGGSAGGHISLLATLNPGLNDPADPKDIDTSVIAYVLFNPAFSPDDSKFADIDAMKFLKADIAPAIAMYGTEDRWLKGAKPVFATLDQLGNTTTELWYAKGEDHAFFNKEPWKTATLIAADRFLVEQGILQGETTLTPPADGAKLIPASELPAANPTP